MYQEGYSRIERLQDHELYHEVQILKVFVDDMLFIFFDITENENSIAYSDFDLENEP